MTDTLTLGKDIPVDFVRKASATEEATAMRRQGRRTRRRREHVETTTGMRTGTPRDEGHESIVEIQGNSPVITQRFIGSQTERIHGMDDTMTFPKLQNDRAERRKTNPTSTDSLEMIFIIVERLDILPNKRTNMRRELDQRHPMNRRNRPVKLEISTNYYTKNIRGPDETGTTIKFALIQLGEHVDTV